MLYSSFILVALFEALAFAAAWEPSTQYEYNAQLDSQDRFWLYWDINADKTVITFEVHARCQGFWGLGFSKNGAMAHADIVVGWIDSHGLPKLSDRHGMDTNGYPPSDLHQDYDLIGGRKNDTHIVMAFSRKIDTCDSDDKPITDDTMRVLFTINDHVPANDDDIVKHDTENRGNRAVYFFDLHNDAPPPTGDDVGIFEVTAHGAPIPENYHTMYYCHVIKRPDTGKVHMTRYEPVIQKGHEGYVHHMVLYQCDEDMSDWLDKEEPCWTYDNNGTPTSESAMRRCTRNFLAAWAVGDNAHIYPPEVGYPLFEEGGPTYYMLETHYDNSNLDKNITDNSGLKIYYTTNLRKEEAGLFTIGTPVSELTQTIPPRMKSFTNYGMCLSPCTEQLPQDGLNIFSGFLHMHLIGRVQKLRQIRNGVELKPLFEDNNWDFNYQQVRMRNKPYPKLLQGDELILECGMDSTERSNVTVGGLETNNEMCLAFMEYFPKPERSLNFCFSEYNYWTVLRELFGIQNITEAAGVQKYDIKTQDGRWMSYDDFMNTKVDWGSYNARDPMTLKERFQKAVLSANQTGYCSFIDNRAIQDRVGLLNINLAEAAGKQKDEIITFKSAGVKFPSEPYVKPDSSCTRPQPTLPSSSGSHLSSMTMFGLLSLIISFLW